MSGKKYQDYHRERPIPVPYRPCRRLRRRRDLCFHSVRCSGRYTLQDPLEDFLQTQGRLVHFESWCMHREHLWRPPVWEGRSHW